MYKLTIFEARNGRVLYVGFFEDCAIRYRAALELIKYYRKDRNLDIEVMFESGESNIYKY